jgi:hypothetical protein
MLSWLSQSVSINSIFHDYTKPISEVFALAQLPAAFLAIVFSGNVHGGSKGEHIYWALVVAEWSLGGFLLSLLWKGKLAKPGAANQRRRNFTTASVRERT